MELIQIINNVFEDDFFSESEDQNIWKYNKKMCLLEINQWMQCLLNTISNPVDFDASSTITQNSNDSQCAVTDKRAGRIGISTVYFTLDRSFGIVAINQEGLNVVAACRFATVAASCAVFSGKWMYELHLGSKGIMQIGWCSNLCNFSSDRGCGDTLNSYAYDGSRLKAWNMLSHDYGELWKTGDVIGVCINLDESLIEFYRNGHSMGVAFRDIKIGSGTIYMPCVSLIEGESVYANFGSRPFKYPIEKFEPLQQKPYIKIKQSEYLYKWLKNLINFVIPSEPNILKCVSDEDITDSRFWNRLYSILCFHLNLVLNNRYCLFNNWLPFIYDITELKKEGKEPVLDNFFKFMDLLWTYTREHHIDRLLYYTFNDMTNSFKQVSETVNCEKKRLILNTCFVLLSHLTTRKFIIKNFIFDRLDFFVLLHHKPLDQKYIDEICQEQIISHVFNTTESPRTSTTVETIFKRTLSSAIKLMTLTGEHWSDLKVAEKLLYTEAFQKLEISYDALEDRQCKILKLLMINTDGNETDASSRTHFLKKFRKFTWHELECSRNDLNSKMPSSIAYATFLRMVRILLELWVKEVGNEKIIFPMRYFYDHTFRYVNCDRIGGLEQYLVHTLRDELVTELGENHRIFNSNVDRPPPHIIPLTEIRAIGLNEAINMLDAESMLDSFLLPTTSNSNVLQAIFAPLFRENPIDIVVGNVDNEKSLLELYEDLLMFFMSTVVKHCKKISKAYSNYEQCVLDYKNIYNNFEEITETPTSVYNNKASCLQNTVNLQKEDFIKRAKKAAWIEHILLNSTRFHSFVTMYEILVNTIREAENCGELFVFVPDFCLEACNIFTELFVKDFHFVKPTNSIEETKPLLIQMADLMVRLMGDHRIKHIDCKKIPIDTLSTLATSATGMNILESLENERCNEFVQKLMMPYADRHWKATNWILVRFWHGSGFGFRYSVLPHHSAIVDNINSIINYTMYNISCSPSVFYQNKVRNYLMDTNNNIPYLVDSIISEIHWTFGEFLAPMQELQRAIERNEQLLMMGRLYKICSTYFDKTIALLRVIDMFIALAPEVFLDSKYPESTSLTKRIIQVILLIIHRISSKQGCFRIVMNSRIAVLENVEYFPIETACVAIILNILQREIDSYQDDDLVIPFFCKMVLTDTSYSYINLYNLIGLPEDKNSSIVSLHDYEKDMLETELIQARKLLRILAFYFPMLSKIKVIPESELCTICYSAPFDVKFSPCGHNSCLSCISYYITKNRQCFFCKRHITHIIKLENNEIIDSLTDHELATEIETLNM